MAFTAGPPKGARQSILQVDQGPLPSSPRLNGFFHLLLSHKGQRKEKDSRPSEPSGVTSGRLDQTLCLCSRLSA